MTNTEGWHTPSTAPSKQPSRSTRLVLVSDTHDRHGQFEVPQGDILLHAGDFSFKGDKEELIRFNAWLEELDFAHKVIIPGNHEVGLEMYWDKATALIPSADAVLDGALYEAAGLKIWGEPRQPWFYNWAYNVHREDMKKVWDKVPTDIDVLLTHGPPLGAGDLTTRGEYVGCEYQRAWILEHQPKLVVCGHIHSGYGLHLLGNTLIANASVCNEKYKPVNAPIVLDL